MNWMNGPDWGKSKRAMLDLRLRPDYKRIIYLSLNSGPLQYRRLIDSSKL